MEAWGSTALAATTSSGNVTQLYRSSISAGAALPIAAGGTLRRPGGGRIGSIVVETDGTNGGVIQLFDINGLDAQADVSSGTTITNTQLTNAINNGVAKKIWEQNVSAAPGSTLVWSQAFGFMRGIAARFVGAAGQVNLNIIGEDTACTQVVGSGFAG